MIFSAQDRHYDLEARALVMGIINATPDSFSDGGLNFATAKAVENALRMVEDGADIIDIGGESTRPGAAAVTAAEESARVLPIVEALAKHPQVTLSVDTYKAEVAAAAVAAGAHIVNDISGFTRDPRMVDVLSQSSCGCVMMHMRGTPQTMQSMTEYEDLIGELHAFFAQQIDRLVASGVVPERIAIDPGIGFSKTIAQNLQLLQQLNRFQSLSRPILIGPSRKSFIGHTLGRQDPAERLWGTAATVACGVLNSARIIRVHDVAAIRDVVDMTMAVVNA